MLVAYMRLFVPDAYSLHRDSDNYAADVKRLGEIALAGVRQFLRSRGNLASYIGTMVKAMAKFDRAGGFDKRKALLAARVRSHATMDPSSLQHNLPWK